MEAAVPNHKLWVRLFFCFLPPQKITGEVTLKDCLRLFTKVDVLDGEERPVRSNAQITQVSLSFCKDDAMYWLRRPHRVCLFLRRALNAKPEESAPRGSASRGSLRSSCSVSFPRIVAFVARRLHFCHLSLQQPLVNTKCFWTGFVPWPCVPSDLKRFSDSNIRASKLSTYVNFPLKELDLGEFASECSGMYLPKQRRAVDAF